MNSDMALCIVFIHTDDLSFETSDRDKDLIPAFETRTHAWQGRNIIDLFTALLMSYHILFKAFSTR